MGEKPKKLSFILIKNCVKLSLAGVFIGLFHKQDLLVASFLMVYLIYVVFRKLKEQSNDKRIFIFGLVLSGIFGVLCEKWGIYYRYWEYHDLSGGRNFPYWLPFAWALAFTFLYGIEKDIIISQKIEAFSSKMLLALLVAMIFPTLGEMITIYLGVWTYHWPYQLLGVPLLAIFLLMVFHTGVNLILTFICKKWDLPNVVFRPNTVASSYKRA